MNENEIRSRNLIRKIEENTALDLRARAAEISTQIREGDDKTVLKLFWFIINLEHAKLYGLGKTVHADREGGWGYAFRDQRFLSSLAGQHMSHCFGIRVSCGGSGGYTPNPLSRNQVGWIRKICSQPFYTLQLALINPGEKAKEPVQKAEPARQLVLVDGPGYPRLAVVDDIPF